MDAARLGRRPGEGPAIVNVHYFGFVLPNLVPMTWWDGRGPRYSGAGP